MPSELSLKNFSFTELFHAEGLKRLDQFFLNELKAKDPSLHASLLAYRAHEPFSALEISELLIACGKVLEDFLIDLFSIENAADFLRVKTLAENPIGAFKEAFVLRRAKKRMSKAHDLPSFRELNTWLNKALKSAPVKTGDKELAVALFGNYLLANSEENLNDIEKLTQWCTAALVTDEGKLFVTGWTSFKLPPRTDYSNLVPTHNIHDKLGRLAYSDEALRFRDGFKLTDPRMNARQVQDEVNYCIYCHDHDGDFCSKGFPVKKGQPELGFKKNPLDVTLAGCPLEEKISEMNLLKKEGFGLASLAMVMIDNPMCPATGHRICNDCMKSCIYQKQEPVNIPQIETRVLTDVLHLPWGVEIYDLLTRWNPLRQNQFVMKPYNGLKILVAGMGPAGFTIAHHLLLEGFAIVGFDGLKIEPLPEKLINAPIHRFDDLIEQLDTRIMMGFGGVAEYGITVRWDKNFLKLIYLSLMRKPYFQVFGSARFGGTVTVDDAWQMGFDHFVVAVGAGLPKALPIPGSLAPGMRQANDFLMALQLGNAAKKESLTNIQIRLPAVIIGGGLTGVDTATEVQAYYITQVEKILYRYEILSNKKDIFNELEIEDQAVLEEFLAHGKAVQEERERAKNAKEQPNFIKLIRQWGGVTIVYRRTMQESPAYINNHEELRNALEEGIYYLEKLEPTSVLLNQFGSVETLLCHKRFHADDHWESLAEEVKIPSRSIFVATGTQPNIAYEFEHHGTFIKQDHRYQTYEDENNNLVVAHGVENCKDPQFGPFTSYHKHDKRVSLIGDTHPVFHGNVVKAIASGLKTYPKILSALKDKLGNVGAEKEYQLFSQKINHAFTTIVHSINRLAENILEIVIHSPQAVKHYKPGQFYRLQNYALRHCDTERSEGEAIQTNSRDGLLRRKKTLLAMTDSSKDIRLQMEPLALIASGVDYDKHLLKFIVIENGATTKICSTLKVGEPVSLMGPTGVRSKISHAQETIMIFGNQQSIVSVLSYGAALKAAGNRVLYVGYYEDQSQVFHQSELEKIADVILWVVKNGEPITLNRSQDYSTQGDALKILKHYAEGKLTKLTPILLTDIDRIFVIGNSDLLRGFQEARCNELKAFFIKEPRVFGSVYSTMQCMLKGVCAQCLQWQIDPETGKRTKAVFACSWQDQPLEFIDVDNLEERLVQNRLQEKITNLWLDECLMNSNT